MIEVAILRSLLECDFASGSLTWKARPVSLFKDSKRSAERSCTAWNNRWAGSPALNSISNGYRSGRIFYQAIYAHRALVALHTGKWPEAVDHINGDRLDNRVANLRPCSLTENNRNASSSVGRSQYKGVSLDLRSQSWVGNIRAGGPSIYLGAFQNEADAARAYDKAALKLHGEFAKLNFPISEGLAP